MTKKETALLETLAERSGLEWGYWDCECVDTPEPAWVVTKHVISPTMRAKMSPTCGRCGKLQVFVKV